MSVTSLISYFQLNHFEFGMYSHFAEQQALIEALNITAVVLRSSSIIAL